MTLLQVEGLSVSKGDQPLVTGVSLTLQPGEVLALVGASGSGKSLTAAAILNMLPKGLTASGAIHGAGRGAMVFQHPARSLNPTRRIGDQLSDVLGVHSVAPAAEMKAQVLTALEEVSLPRRCATAYPFELSGGQAQRAAIAIALASRPAFVIADEATTDLDTLAQAAVLALLGRLVGQRGMGALLITHDLSLAARHAPRIAVMDGGRLVEQGPTADLLAAPAHWATRQLLAASARVQPRPPPEPGAVLIEARGLSRSYGRRRLVFGSRPHAAVTDVSLSLQSGESLGLIGPSGSGKSTLLRLLARLDAPDSGGITIAGHESQQSIRRFTRSPARRLVQIVLQDATGSLNPRFDLRRILADPLGRLCPELSATQREARIQSTLAAVDLPAALLDRLPHQLSGGQRARAGLARALVVRPKLLLLDEATSSLDAPLQAAMLDLIDRLRREQGLGVVAVTHDMAVVERLCDRLAVMSEGRIVEQGTVAAVIGNPAHAVTRALIAARPSPLPAAADPASGGR